MARVGRGERVNREMGVCEGFMGEYGRWLGLRVGFLVLVIGVMVVQVGWWLLLLRGG